MLDPSAANDSLQKTIIIFSMTHVANWICGFDVTQRCFQIRNTMTDSLAGLKCIQKQ